MIKPVRLIFDTDMLTDCDDAAALAMLHILADMGEAEILATVVSSKYPNSAPVVSAVNDYYGRSDIPLGVPKDASGVYRDNSTFLDKVTDEFPHRIKSNDEAPDAVEVYRKALHESDDASVKILTVGYMSNLVKLLMSQPDDISPLTGMELVKRKVSEWICMGGNFPVDDARDNVNFTRDPAAAVSTINAWPGKITFVGREIGHNIFVGDRLKRTPESNPVRRAYQLHREFHNPGGGWNHHTADPSAVLYAVRGLSDYFDISSEGRINIADDCSFTWLSISGGNQRYLIQKMDRGQMGRIMEDLMVAPPASRVIWIGNDHGGYEMKLSIKEYLESKGYSVYDAGADSSEISWYPYYASKVAGAVSKGEARRGILICSTGIGMSIAANKFKGVRASLCTSTYMGKMTRAHNNSNVLCLGGKITGIPEAISILNAWLAAEYEGGRHDISLDLILEAEAALCTGNIWNP